MKADDLREPLAVAGRLPLRHAWRRGTLPVDTGLWRFSLVHDFHPPGDMQDWQLRHRGPHSYIYDLAGTDGILAKIIVPRSQPRDSLRKYGLSQARREFASNRKLAALGLAAPTVCGWAVSLAPGAKYESVLFMRALPDFTSGLTLIRTETDPRRRQAFLRRLACDLGAIQGNGYIHKDCHFDNLCVLADERLVWIDNDIRRSRHRAARREGLQKTLALLRTTARGDIGVSEWNFFKQQLGEALARWPAGKTLVDEIQ